MQGFLDGLGGRLLGGEAVVAGVLSGTSADGIDVGLCRFSFELVPTLVAFETLAFPGELGPRVREVLDGGELGLANLARLDRDLGRAFGQAARTLAERTGLSLDLVGCHGQTVWHHDGASGEPASLQIGNGDFLAEAAGCPTIVDFRQADLAAGGEGAPLVSILDEVLFAGLALPLAVLNLGGMANLTLLRGEDSLAFDVGPACSLLDGLARRLLGRERDDQGRVASGGRIQEDFVAEILAHPFFARRPPKSTGRDTFGESWVQGLLAPRAGQAPGDLLASAAEAIARAVAADLDSPRELLVAGGGGHHRFLMERLAHHVSCPVRSTGFHGIDPDGREALLFALLAARWVLGRPSTQPWATGARPGRVLGRLCPGPSVAGGAGSGT